MSRHWLVIEGSGARAPAPYSTRLAGAGRHLPATHLTTDELMSTTRHSTHIDLERLTGIHERRVSIGDEDSYSLATSAARDCLEKAQQKAASLDVVIRCSITKLRGGLTQWVEPTMSSAVARAIGAEKAMTFDLSNACAGMLTGVTVLNNWIRQGTVERGLVVSGEYISQLGQNAARHIRNIMSKELACLTLGDAGAALLLERAPPGLVGSVWPASPPLPTTADFAWLIRRATIRAPGCSPIPGRSSVRRSRTPHCCCTKSSSQRASQFTTSIT